MEGCYLDHMTKPVIPAVTSMHTHSIPLIANFSLSRLPPLRFMLLSCSTCRSTEDRIEIKNNEY